MELNSKKEGLPFIDYKGGGWDQKGYSEDFFLCFLTGICQYALQTIYHSAACGRASLKILWILEVPVDW